MTVDESEQKALNITERAGKACRIISEAGAVQKNNVLHRLAALLEENTHELIECNDSDIAAAKEKGIPDALAQRLAFKKDKIKARALSLIKIASLPDPVGRMFDMKKTENGLIAGKMRVPLGVILLIYEARPHVTINSGAFALKSGNAIICKGGSEAKHTNAYLNILWRKALLKEGLPGDTVQIVSISHGEVEELLGMKDKISLVIPRGGKELIETVVRKSKIPVIKHYEGVCHVYIGKSADIKKAVDIALDSKILMPAVCNAAETLLMDKDNSEHIPGIIKSLSRQGIEIRGCEKLQKIVPGITPASQEDWRTEYLDKIYSVKVVEGIDEAIDHINRFGSGHTDAIVTENYSDAQKFTRGVDSGVVLVNASTMFCDGETLGMGAEIGISTDKIHARGPMGLEELTSYKHVITGEGQVMGGK